MCCIFIDPITNVTVRVTIGTSSVATTQFHTSHETFVTTSKSSLTNAINCI